jgi:hypothetical protein
VLSNDRIRELVALGNENRNLDYKGPFSWTEATNEERCEIVKDVLAFANTRDGGIILIGVNDKTGILEGLTEEQYASFDQTRFNEFVHKYADPRHTCKVHRQVVDGHKLIAIEVPEFADVPILSKHSVQSVAKASQLILRQAGLYMRTDKASSQLIEDADEMRELLNRGVFRRQDELMYAIKQILQPSSAPNPRGSGNLPLKESAYSQEIEAGMEFLKETLGGKLSKAPHWTIAMCPATYAPVRIASLSALQRHVQASAVSLRGWTFPIVNRVGNSGWSNFAGGSESSYDSRSHAAEALRAYVSGLILWCAQLWEDESDLAPKGRRVLSFISAIFSATEWTTFAQRYFEPLVPIEEPVYISVTLEGTLNRELISADRQVDLPAGYRAGVDMIPIQEIVPISELRTDPLPAARRIVRRLFEMFNWNDPSEAMLQTWQQDLLSKRRGFVV